MFGRAGVSFFDVGLSALEFEVCPTGLTGAVGAVFELVCGLSSGLTSGLEVSEGLGAGFTSGSGVGVGVGVGVGAGSGVGSSTFLYSRRRSLYPSAEP